MYYYQSSELTQIGKIKNSLWTLLIWTAVPVVICVGGWVYLYLTGKITMENTPKTVISLTNA